jgi:hypothetical protein
MKRTVFLPIALLSMLLFSGFAHFPSTDAQVYAQKTGYGQPLMVKGNWQTHAYDLVYTVAFSSQQQPDGPLVIYRASAADQSMTVPIAAIARNSSPATPLLFPSADGRYVALLKPLRNTFNGGAINVISTENGAQAVVLPSGAAIADQPVWSSDNQALYYHTGATRSVLISGTSNARLKGSQQRVARNSVPVNNGYDEIHRVDLHGHDSVLLHLVEDDNSLRMLGVDRTGALILTLARPGKPLALVRVSTTTKHIQNSADLHIIMTLPKDILPGNVLGIGSDGNSVECERVQNWHPLHYTTIDISFSGGATMQVAEPFNTFDTSKAVNMLSTSADNRVQAMARVLSVRTDLMAHGILNVPSQEALLLQDKQTGAVQQMTLPPGGQIVQTFWTRHIPVKQLHGVSPQQLTALLAIPDRVVKPDLGRNADPKQQDEWMLEVHGNNLAGGPVLPKMCYATCPNGPVGEPHVSAAILHGVAFTESNWHHFNTSDYNILNEAIGSPIKSFDGGWGEYQQTWAMPPQCENAGNCRSDANKIQNSQSYNIGTGAQSLISSWNTTAGVSSKNATNDPYKANHWFFAVWSYNGSYGNNPNDVASSVYGHWYPGAPFRSIYEEYVWYYAAHPQSTTDNYQPSLGSNLLPPQSDFTDTSDSYVSCATCYIPDWTNGTYDREWVGKGTDAKTAGYIRATFNANGGEDMLGLPHDTGSGAEVHHVGDGQVQDFGGDPSSQGEIMLADKTTTAYWVSGGVWTQYSGVDHATTGCHGYPTSALAAYKDAKLGSGNYQRQNFQKGYIIWNTTNKTVAQDVCS